MKELPDDELDKLFRKSAEELDSNFDPQDWNTLRKRLDENDGKTGTAWLKKWWPAGMLALLMFVGLTTYLLTNSTDKEDKKGGNIVSQLQADIVLNKKQIEKIPENTKRGRAAEKVTDIVNGIDSGAVRNAESKSGNNHELSSNNEAELTGNSSKTFGKAKTELKKNSSTEKRIQLVEPDSKLSELVSSEKNSVITTDNPKILPRRWSKTGGVYLEPNHYIGRGDGAPLSENGIKQNEDVIKSDVEKVKSDKLNPAISNRAGNDNSGDIKNNFPIVDNERKAVDREGVSDGLTRVDTSGNVLESRSLVMEKMNSLPKEEVEETEIQPVSEAVKENSEKEPSPKFALRFGYSPDLSATGLRNFTKPGTAVSLLIEYAILPKLYIQSGVARSSKVYNAEEGSYMWPSSLDDQTILPYSIDGVCKIIEIPLNVRFDISQNERSRWFVGAGVSSYHMQNEKYVYNYKVDDPDIKWYGWHGSTGWYWLSHLNASVGYEYRFSKTLSLLAEPYVRIPVKKVGFGKVDLFTAGMWFSIRYTPKFKINR